MILLGNTLVHRRLEAEWLDQLPANDPAALASRRDLVWINALMFQAKAMSALLTAHRSDPPRRILEIGAGDGAFTLALARRLPRPDAGVDLVLLDRVDLVDAARRRAFAALGWHVRTVTADVFEWLGRTEGETFDLVMANLFLHHFEDKELVRLFSALMPFAPLVLAAEPLRARLPLAAARALRLIGANHVSRHDAAVSVRAGFRGRELSSLWQAAGGNPLDEGKRFLFTHVFAGASLWVPT